MIYRRNLIWLKMKNQKYANPNILKPKTTIHIETLISQDLSAFSYWPMKAERVA